MDKREPVAWDDRASREAVRDYRRKAVVALVAGLNGLIAWDVFIELVDTDAMPGFVTRLCVTWSVAAAFSLCWGVSGTWKTWRARRLLRHVPWASMPATYRISPIGGGNGNGWPVLVLHEAASSGDDDLLAVAATVFRYRRLPESVREPHLVARARHGWSVVAPLDRSVVVIAKRPRFPGHGVLLRRALNAAP